MIKKRPVKFMRNSTGSHVLFRGCNAVVLEVVEPRTLPSLFSHEQEVQQKRTPRDHQSFVIRSTETNKIFWPPVLLLDWTVSSKKSIPETELA